MAMRGVGKDDSRDLREGKFLLLYDLLVSIAKFAGKQIGKGTRQWREFKVVI